MNCTVQIDQSVKMNAREKEINNLSEKKRKAMERERDDDPSCRIQQTSAYTKKKQTIYGLDWL